MECRNATENIIVFTLYFRAYSISIRFACVGLSPHQRHTIKEPQNALRLFCVLSDRDRPDRWKTIADIGEKYRKLD